MSSPPPFRSRRRRHRRHLRRKQSKFSYRTSLRRFRRRKPTKWLDTVSEPPEYVTSKQLKARTLQWRKNRLKCGTSGEGGKQRDEGWRFGAGELELSTIVFSMAVVGAIIAIAKKEVDASFHANAPASSLDRALESEGPPHTGVASEDLVASQSTRLNILDPEDSELEMGGLVADIIDDERELDLAGHKIFGRNTGMWRTLVFKGPIERTRRCICVEGRIYFLTVDQMRQRVIVAFILATEEFLTIPLSQNAMKEPHEVQTELIELGGHVALSDLRKAENGNGVVISLYILLDNAGGNWTERRIRVMDDNYYGGVCRERSWPRSCYF
ncbi:hypothetical protein NL676_039770 [Syzygium grande]|nr:hypothetical protein NL676_039770 [Syzygium grande]